MKPLLTDEEIFKATGFVPEMNDAHICSAFDAGAKYARNYYEEKIKQKDERIKEMEELLEDAFEAGAEFQYGTPHYHKERWVNYQSWKNKHLKD